MPHSRLFMSSLSRRELARRRPGRSPLGRVTRASRPATRSPLSTASRSVRWRAGGTALSPITARPARGGASNRVWRTLLVVLFVAAFCAAAFLLGHGAGS